MSVCVDTPNSETAFKKLRSRRRLKLNSAGPLMNPMRTCPKPNRCFTAPDTASSPRKSNQAHCWSSPVRPNRMNGTPSDRQRSMRESRVLVRGKMKPSAFPSRISLRMVVSISSSVFAVATVSDQCSWLAAVVIPAMNPARNGRCASGSPVCNTSAKARLDPVRMA